MYAAWIFAITVSGVSVASSPPDVLEVEIRPVEPEGRLGPPELPVLPVAPIESPPRSPAPLSRTSASDPRVAPGRRLLESPLDGDDSPVSKSAMSAVSTAIVSGRGFFDGTTVAVGFGIGFGASRSGATCDVGFIGAGACTGAGGASVSTAGTGVSLELLPQATTASRQTNRVISATIA